MVRHSTQVLTARYEVILSKVSKSVIMEQGGKLVIHTYTGLSHIRECSHNTRRCRVSDTGVILSKEVATVRCEVILTNMCSSVLMEHGGQARSSIILSMTVYGQLKGISN